MHRNQLQYNINTSIKTVLHANRSWPCWWPRPEHWTCGERPRRRRRCCAPRNRSVAVAPRPPPRRSPCLSVACVCRVCSSGWPAPAWSSAVMLLWCQPPRWLTTSCRTRPAAPRLWSRCPSPPGVHCPSASAGPT